MKKVKKIINEEAEVDIPKKNKNQAIIVKFSMFYRARKKLKNDIMLPIDLTKKRFNLPLDAQLFIQGIENVKYVSADITCNLKTKVNDKLYKQAMTTCVSTKDWG